MPLYQSRVGAGQIKWFGLDQIGFKPAIVDRTGRMRFALDQHRLMSPIVVQHEPDGSILGRYGPARTEAGDVRRTWSGLVWSSPVRTDTA